MVTHLFNAVQVNHKPMSAHTRNSPALLFFMHGSLPFIMAGCTMNFWSLRTGILDGEITGDLNTTLVYAEGCNDLNLFATNNQSNAMLLLELKEPLQQMADANHRLETIVVDERDDFSLTLWRGRDLYNIPCDYAYDSYYDYYGYYGYGYDEPTEDPGGGIAAREAYTYTAGTIRLHLTAQRRRWDARQDTVHAKTVLQDVTLTHTETGETVFVDGLIMQTYVYQWYWY